MKIGIYGGSFDPIHYGHLRPVRQAMDALALDRVVYLPTAQPPHKLGRAGAPAHARYAMVELALLGEDGMFASPLELTDRIAYTVETLEHFRREQPSARLFLIVGSDSLSCLDTWREWRKILRLAELAVLARPADPLREPSPALRSALDPSRVHRIENAPVAVSSTEVRRRIAAGSLNLHLLLPPLVLDYIYKYGLYQQDPSPDPRF